MNENVTKLIEQFKQLSEEEQERILKILETIVNK